MHFSEPVTLSHLAAFLGAKAIGDPAHLVSGINEVHCVLPGDLTFVDVAKYYDTALSSLATTILINQEVTPPAGKALLVSDDPFRDFNRITDHFRPETGLTAQAQPKLGEGVKVGQNVVFGVDTEVGEGTEIGHGAVIGSGVRIGSGCKIYPNVFIADHSVIGNDVIINANAVIGAEAFYYKRRPDRTDQMLTKGRVVISNRVHIGAGVTIDRGVTGDTFIGEDTKIDNLCQIGHEVRIGRQCIIAAQVGIAGLAVIEDEVKLWGQVGVVQKVKIGRGAQVLGQSGVMTELEPGKTYLGSPADESRKQLRVIALLRKLPDLFSTWRKDGQPG